MKNPNCDNDKCRTARGQIRILPTGGDSNALLCRACYQHEINYRRERNRELSKDCAFKLPTWESLKIYGEPELEAIHGMNSHKVNGD